MRCAICNISLLLHLSLVINQLNCEIFSSIEELKKLAANEKVLIFELENFAHQVKDDYVYRKLKAWKEDCIGTNKTQRLPNFTNPLNAFLMIKRATSDIQLIERRFPHEIQGLLRNINHFVPDDGDLLGAVEGLLLLQFFYKLKTADFANSVDDGEVTRHPLSVHDLFVIGQEASKIEGPEIFALEYLELVRWGLKEERDADNEVDEKNLLLHLIALYKCAANYGKSLEIPDELTTKFPETARDRYFGFLKKSFLDKVDKLGPQATIADPFTDHFVRDGVFSDSKDRILTGKVCRGDLVQTSHEVSRLRCRYMSTNSFTKLARFNVEEANLDPYIISFVDALSDDEIEILKEAWATKQGPGTVTDANLQQKVTNRRIAQIPWHSRNEDETFRKLSRRVEDMTSLSQTYAEPLQTQNYGIGGHYVGHWDCFMPWDTPFERDGNRIATVLFYLSDVEKGGATVFPFLKLRISPRKGTAIFWHNLSSSGTCDFLTRHSACPVLLGNKWVANQWIREHGNEIRANIYEADAMQKVLFQTFY